MGDLVSKKLAGNASVEWPWHVIFGVSVLALMAIRLLVRLAQGAPNAKPTAPEAMQTGRKWGHILLYTMAIATPIGGAAVWFFGLKTIGELHPWAAKALLIIAGGHAVFALIHQFVLKDGTLMRMIKPKAS